jgi:signal transduction histidine kinase
MKTAEKLLEMAGGEAYCGKILHGAFSDELKQAVADYISRFRGFDQLGTPALPYICAWKEGSQIIWYEFVSHRLTRLLGCRPRETAETFRQRVLDRRIYKPPDPLAPSGIRQEIISHQQLQALRQGLRREVKQKGGVEAVYKIDCGKGQFIWLKDQARTEVFPRDRLNVSLGSLTTVSREMELEEEYRITRDALEHSNATLNEILSVSPVGIGMLKKMTVNWANSCWYTMFGFEAGGDPFPSVDVRRLFASPQEFERVRREIGTAFARGLTAELDAVFQKKDGSTFPGHIKISPPDASRPDRGLIFTVTDEAERKRVEAERTEREKLHAILEMAGAVCHELNQPMTAIAGYGEITLMKTPKDDPNYEKVAKIMEQIRRMGRITKKLMKVTRYRTRDYVDGTRIIDIDEASAGPEPEGPA